MTTTEWDSRAEAWQARKHSTTIRRSRKGGDNSRTYRRGLAPVQGAIVSTWTDEVPSDIADAIRADIQGSHRLILGTSGLDLAKLVDRYADVLGLEPLLGTEGSSKAFRQVFHVDKASPGADVMDAVALTARRDTLTSWAESPGARAAFQMVARVSSDDDSDDSFKLAGHEPDRMEWPERMTAGTARSRKSESDVAGPRVPGTDGRLHRTGNLYGAAFHRNGRRYTEVTRRQTVPVWPRVGWYPARPYGLAPFIGYGTIRAWQAILPGTWTRSPGIRSITDHSGAPVEWRHLTVTDDRGYDDRPRVFIGHRSIVRGKARQVDIKSARHLGAFKLAGVSDVRYLVELLAPETLATFTVVGGETFGTVARNASGRFDISVNLVNGKARHRPKGAPAAIEYLTRYLLTA